MNKKNFIIVMLIALFAGAVAGGPANETCEGCAADAIRTAWSVLSSTQAQPVHGARPLAVDDALTREYAGLDPARE